MQLKIKRSQRVGGILGNTAIFCVDARAEFSPAERSAIDKYKLGKTVVYNSKTFDKHADAATTAGGGPVDISTGAGAQRAAGAFAKQAFHAIAARMSLVITIDSLERGQRIECKDLDEVLGAEDALHTSCQSIKTYLDLAATFDGREVVVDYAGQEPTVLAPSAAAPAPVTNSIALATAPSPNDDAVVAPPPAVALRPTSPAPESSSGLEAINAAADRFVAWFTSLTSAQKVGVVVGALLVLWLLSAIL